jgi:hypothetical protein
MQITAEILRASMRYHEKVAALRLVTKNRARTWSSRVRNEIEQRLSYLRMDAETEEEKRDVQRLWDVMNAICAKHDRKAAANEPKPR